MMKQNKSASGFTLIELIIVVGIIGVVTTIGMANYFGERSKRRLELATEILVRELDLTAARSRAQEGSYQWWVHFDNPAGSGNDFYVVCYGVYAGSGADCIADGGSESKRIMLGVELEFTEPVTGTTKDVTFNKATGLPTAATIVTINSVVGSGSKTITINPNGSIEF